MTDEFEEEEFPSLEVDECELVLELFEFDEKTRELDIELPDVADSLSVPPQAVINKLRLTIKTGASFNRWLIKYIPLLRVSVSVLKVQANAKGTILN
jgi:hypothetical protein